MLTQWICGWDRLDHSKVSALGEGNQTVLYVWFQGTRGFGVTAAHLAHGRLPSPVQQVGSIPANAADDGQWSQGLISAVSHLFLPLHLFCGFPKGG